MQSIRDTSESKFNPRNVPFKVELEYSLQDRNKVTHVERTERGWVIISGKNNRGKDRSLIIVPRREKANHVIIGYDFYPGNMDPDQGNPPSRQDLPYVAHLMRDEAPDILGKLKNDKMHKMAQVLSALSSPEKLLKKTNDNFDYPILDNVGQKAAVVKKILLDNESGALLFIAEQFSRHSNGQRPIFISVLMLPNGVCFSTRDGFVA